MNTGGVHAAASTLIAYVRRPLIIRLLGRDADDLNRISIHTLGSSGFLTYAGLSTLIHQIFLLVLDVFKLGEIFSLLYRSLLGAAITFGLMLLQQLVSQTKKRDAV